MIAFHYPKTEHRDELLQRLERAAEIMRTAPGFIDVEVGKEETTGALVTTETRLEHEVPRRAIPHALACFASRPSRARGA